MRSTSKVRVLLALVATALTVAGCSSAAATTVTLTVTPSEPGMLSTAPTSAAPVPATPTTSAPATTADPVTTSAPARSTHPTPPPKPVHVSMFEGDGKTYGVGIAIMALFSKAPTDSEAFTRAATVTVNGKPADGAWFWQAPTIPGYAMEALYREQKYWPAHSQIAVHLPVKGLAAGPGLAYDDSVTLNMKIGAAHISTVNNAAHKMAVTSDGLVVRTMPVSLGSADHPTYDGTKVVMEKDNPVRMVSAPGEAYYNVLVPWSVRLTDSGEFVHAASWNTGNIGSRNTSHGCTNLDVGDAEWFYNFTQLGDVVQYPDANSAGTVQPSWDGWGWWNLSWNEWLTGGELLNH